MTARTLIVAALLLAGGAALLAGPLNPPAGPVASTYKTLAEVEPRIAINAANTPGDLNSVFRITQPGSYYLTGNVDSAASLNKTGIEIAASNVTIDLNGYMLQGGAGSIDGINGDGGLRDNIRIHNGVIRTWGSDGIDLAAGTNHHIASVSAYSNAGNGIRCTGSGALVESCSVSNNGLNGIFCGANAAIDGCTAASNTFDGISCFGPSSAVRSCAANQNGDEGIEIGGSGVVAACSAHGNLGTGIWAGMGAVVENCSARQNSADGITTSTGCTVTGCSAHGNGVVGIDLAGSCTVSDSTVVANAGHGILAGGGGCSILNCMARANTGDGIRVVGACLVRGNSCVENGSGGDGAGIHALGGDSNIDGNTVTGNDRGIDVDTLGNVIVRNSASTNTTNYDIVAGNQVGPTSVVSSATSPWANLTF